MAKTGTILIVDDQKIDVDILKNIFEETFNVDTAYSGMEAMNMLQKNKYDVAILDLIMPVVSGIDLIKQIRANNEFENLGIVVATDEASLEREALTAGADDFLTKPFSAEVVKKRVMNVYERVVLEERLQAKLEEVKYSYDAFTYSMPGGIAIYNYKDGKIELLSFNDGLCEILDMNRKEFEDYYGQDATAIINFEDRYRVFKEIDQASYDGEVITLSHRINDKLGGIKWVHVNVTKQRQANGETWLRAIYVDITAEKETEIKLNKLNAELFYAIKHDDLTGIYNKQAFCDATEEMLDNSQDDNYLLVRVNIKGFKIINDIYGQEYGDKVLAIVAEDISRAINVKGTYGRIGNDHFVFCIKESQEEVIDVLGKNHTVTHNIYGAEVKISFSIGIYVITDKKIPVTIMCDRANMALQSIKGSSIKHMAYYDVTMRTEMLKEQRITNEVVHAMENEEFEAFFQFIYSFVTNEFTGAEALVRWRKPGQNRLISPGEFIPVLEKNGGIIDLDKYVWDKVCKKQRELLDKGIDILPVSVNVSALHFTNLDFAKEFIELVKKYDLPPSAIRVEITESAYAGNARRVQELVVELQSYGIKILMDDFGSEYSSFNMLKDISVDVIKIDMGFMKDFDTVPRTKTILASIIRMAKWINLPTVVEGVETSEQVQFLRGVGNPFVQGYYYSKPISAAEYEEELIKLQRRKSKQRSHENTISYNVATSQPSYEELLEKASTDAVTGVLNRATTEEMISSELYVNIAGAGALAIYDIDNFKKYNDTFGHPKGDKLLKDIADIVTNHYEDEAIIGRLGGDEFVIYVKNMNSREDVIADLEICCQQIRDIGINEEEELPISVSMGVCFISENEKIFEDAFEKADVALYKAKYNGKNQISIYED